MHIYSPKIIRGMDIVLFIIIIATLAGFLVLEIASLEESSNTPSPSVSQPIGTRHKEYVPPSHRKNLPYPYQYKGYGAPRGWKGGGYV